MQLLHHCYHDSPYSPALFKKFQLINLIVLYAIVSVLVTYKMYCVICSQLLHYCTALISTCAIVMLIMKVTQPFGIMEGYFALDYSTY